MSVLEKIWKSSINRNIVECKVISRAALVRLFRVLIETLWNVKLMMQDAENDVFSNVLIETLWNVKI